MKIAVVSNDYHQSVPTVGYGGIETCIDNLMQGLQDFRWNCMPHIDLNTLTNDENLYKFFAVVPKRDGGPHRQLFTVYDTPSLPTSKQSPSNFIYDVRDILKEKKPDVIWSQSHWSVEPLLELNIPIICTFHDGLAQKQKGWMINDPRVKYRFISQFQYNTWVKEDWEKKASFVAYTGLEQDEYQLRDDEREYFLWVAGFAYGFQGKGLDDFIYLAQQNPSEKFVCYGSGNEQISNYLRQVSKGLKNFEFRGELKRGEEHREAFRKAKAFLMLSKLPEALGRVSLEALSKGTPVIGTKYGATPEIVGNCGVTSNNIKVLNKALKMKFDHQACFEYSKKFHVKNEIRALLKASNYTYESHGWDNEILFQSEIDKHLNSPI